MLSTIKCEKIKTNYDLEGNVQCHVDWKFCDAGYNVMADAQHYAWFFYIYNASRIAEPHDHYVKIAVRFVTAATITTWASKAKSS